MVFPECLDQVWMPCPSNPQRIPGVCQEPSVYKELSLPKSIHSRGKFCIQAQVLLHRFLLLWNSPKIILISLTRPRSQYEGFLKISPRFTGWEEAVFISPLLPMWSHSIPWLLLAEDSPCSRIWGCERYFFNMAELEIHSFRFLLCDAEHMLRKVGLLVEVSRKTFRTNGKVEAFPGSRLFLSEDRNWTWCLTSGAS